MDVNINDVYLFTVLRTFVFLDEWGFYILLASLYKLRFPMRYILLSSILGSYFNFVAYENLAEFKSQIGIKERI
jgi:hypothetical protein